MCHSPACKIGFVPWDTQSVAPKPAPDCRDVYQDAADQEYQARNDPGGGITLLHRPVARFYGGHIERLIGTMTGKVHLLPGTTDASPAALCGYDSEATAVLTLPEFAPWLSLEIGQFHHHEYRIAYSAQSERRFHAIVNAR